MSEDPFITARYVTRFQCIGSACENSCCDSGWIIPVDRLHYQALKKKMDGTKAERERFRGSLQRNRADDANEQTYALLRMDEKGRCAFLEKSGQCGMHGRYGAEALGNVCAQYPRKLNAVGARRELWGDLSCPEMARLCLLDPEALTLVDATRDPSTQRMVLSRLPDENRPPYARYYDDLRAFVAQLLARRDYPLRSRLFFFAYFANRTASFLHADATSVDEARLLAEMQRVEDPANLKPLHDSLAGLEVPRALAVTLVTELAGAAFPIDALKALVKAVMGTYAADAGLAPGAQADPEALWTAYARRRDRWTERHGARIDGYFKNYLRNAWLKDGYLRAPNLLAHAQRQYLLLAMLRFLLFGHPWLVEAGEDPADDLATGALDRAAVDVVHRVVRAVEHTPVLLTRIQERLQEGEMQDLAHTAMLALV